MLPAVATGGCRLTAQREARGGGKGRGQGEGKVGIRATGGFIGLVTGNCLTRSFHEHIAPLPPNLSWC